MAAAARSSRVATHERDHTLRAEREGRVLTVWIDAPPYNFLDRRMIFGLDALTRTLKGDRSIGAVVLASAVEGAWVTHAKIEELTAGARALGQTPPRWLAQLLIRSAGAVNRLPRLRRQADRTALRGVLQLRRAGDVLRRMNRLDQFVIAAIGGNALGAGWEVAMGCDYRITADADYRVGLIESTIGLSTGTGALQRMARSVGLQTALALTADGRYMTPREARQMGLVNEVVPPGRLLDAAQAVAARVARRPPETIGAIKRNLYDGITRPLTDAVTLEQATYASIAAHPATVRAGDELARQIEEITPRPYVADEIWTEWYRGTHLDMVDRRS